MVVPRRAFSSAARVRASYGPDVPAVAHEERRRPARAAGVGARHVAPDARRQASLVEVAGEPLDVEPELAGVRDEVLVLEPRPGGRTGGRASPRTRPGAPPPRPPGRRARSGRARRGAAGGGRRSAGRRRAARAARFTVPVARLQNGHSKSPYSTSVSGASGFPRMWSCSGSTGRSRNSGSVAVRSPRSTAAPLKITQPTSVASAAASSTPTVASDCRCVVEREVGDEQRHREADARERRTAEHLADSDPRGKAPSPSRTVPSASRRFRPACRRRGRRRRPRSPARRGHRRAPRRAGRRPRWPARTSARSRSSSMGESRLQSLVERHRAHEALPRPSCRRWAAATGGTRGTSRSPPRPPRGSAAGRRRAGRRPCRPASDAPPTRPSPTHSPRPTTAYTDAAPHLAGVEQRDRGHEARDARPAVATRSIESV